MEQKQICSSDGMISLSANYPWLVAQTFDEEETDITRDQIFYNVSDLTSHYRCQIPELLGRRIRGCFHGWVILSNHPHGDKWSLWNPVASKLIRLPRLIVKDGDSDDIRNCCLTSPPDDPGSVLLLTRDTKPHFVFCRLDRKRKRLRWTEMSYFKQLRCITGREHGSILRLASCNGKLYALTDASLRVIYVQIVVNDKEVVISLSPIVDTPYNRTGAGEFRLKFLKGFNQELYIIMIGFTRLTKRKPVDVSLCKLDMTNMVWAKINQLKGTTFFVDIDCNMSATCSLAIASELGSYVHIIHEKCKVMYSYDINDKSLSMNVMQCLDLPPRPTSGGLRTSHISVWIMPGFRLRGVYGEAKCKPDSKEDEMVVRSCKNIDEVEFNSKTNDPHLLNIPFHVLERIMKFCTGIEYLNFCATCKHCHLAAPVIRWRHKSTTEIAEIFIKFTVVGGI